MNLLNKIKPAVIAVIVIALMLIMVSLVDIILVFISSRFYSNLAFIILFGIGGVFAAILGYAYGIKFARRKNEWARWTLVLTLVGSGLIFFFFLARIEGGEYGPAFKSFGIALAVTSLIFARGNVDL